MALLHASNTLIHDNIAGTKIGGLDLQDISPIALLAVDNLCGRLLVFEAAGAAGSTANKSIKEYASFILWIGSKVAAYEGS